MTLNRSHYVECLFAGLVRTAAARLGMFMFTARTLLEELASHAPDVLHAVRRAVAERQSDLDFIRLGVAAFSASPAISLDYAVAERTRRAAVVPADIGWSDVGSWGALWELGRKDTDGNVAVGDVLLEGARNCYVRSDGMLAAVVGLQDAVVVVTEDAVPRRWVGCGVRRVRLRSHP